MTKERGRGKKNTRVKCVKWVRGAIVKKPELIVWGRPERSVVKKVNGAVIVQEMTKPVEEKKKLWAVAKSVILSESIRYVT